MPEGTLEQQTLAEIRAFFAFLTSVDEVPKPHGEEVQQECMRQKNSGQKNRKQDLASALIFMEIPRKGAKPQRIQAAENYCDFLIHFSVPYDFVAVALLPAPRAAVWLCFAAAEFSPRIGREAAGKMMWGRMIEHEQRQIVLTDEFPRKATLNAGF